MKGNRKAFPLPPRNATAGTPAGEGRYTQEQHALLREFGLSIREVPALKILVAVRPSPSVREWADHWAQLPTPPSPPPPIEEMDCPVIEQGPGWAIFIAPDGTTHRVPVRRTRRG